MRESIMSPSNHPPRRVFAPEQIASRRSWSRVPDENTAVAAMSIIHVRPLNGSTITELNPLDIGTVADRKADEDNDLGGLGWLDIPHAAGSLFSVARP